MVFLRLVKAHLDGFIVCPTFVKRMVGKYFREVVRSGSIGSSIAPMMEPALIKSKNSDCPVKIYGLM